MDGPSEQPVRGSCSWGSSRVAAGAVVNEAVRTRFDGDVWALGVVVQDEDHVEPVAPMMLRMMPVLVLVDLMDRCRERDRAQTSGALTR